MKAADGMKTGFVCNSGFNLVATATIDGRRLGAVIFGASSGKHRADLAEMLLVDAFGRSDPPQRQPLSGIANMALGGIVPADLTTTICRQKAPVQLVSSKELQGWGISFGTYDTAVKADMALRGRLLSASAAGLSGPAGVIRMPGKAGFAAVVWKLDRAPEPHSLRQLSPGTIALRRAHARDLRADRSPDARAAAETQGAERAGFGFRQDEEKEEEHQEEALTHHDQQGGTWHRLRARGSRTLRLRAEHGAGRIREWRAAGGEHVLPHRHRWHRLRHHCGAARRSPAPAPSGAGEASSVQCVATLVISVGYLASVQFIPVGLAVIIFFSFPVLIMLAAPLVEGHSPGLARIVIAVFAFAGLGVAIGPSFNDLDIRGILLAAAAAVACVLQFFSGRSISTYMTPTVFGSLVHLTILPAAFLVALYAGDGVIRIFPGGTATGPGLAFMAGVGAIYVVAYMVHMLSLRFAPASTVAPYYNLEPVVTTLVAAVLLGERLNLNQYLGGGMVLTALIASSLIGLRRATRP